MIPRESNLEDLHGTKIIINELKKSKKFRISDDNKLSIASSIKYRNVYTEFTSACFYFINSNIYINKSNSYREYIKDNLICEDYKNFENNKNN